MSTTALTVHNDKHAEAVLAAGGLDGMAAWPGAGEAPATRQSPGTRR